MSDLALVCSSLAAATEDSKENLVNLVWSVAVLAAVFIGLLSIRLKSKDLTEPLLIRAERLILALIYLAGLSIGGLALYVIRDYEYRWGLLLAFFPYLLILQHATFLRIVRQPALTPMGDPRRDDRGAGRDTSPAPATAPEDDDSDSRWWPTVLENARSTSERYFGPVSLAVRYGTAAIAVLLVGLSGFVVLFVDDGRILASVSPEHRDLYVHAARLGLGGAYVYTLVHLGRRNFTHDVTSGGAIWCSIVLAVGPILAAIVSHLLHATDPAPTPNTVPSPDAFGVQLIYFMAGFSPRLIISFMERVAKKAWGPPAAATVVSSRTVPVTQVAGVTAEVAERLEEEGIFDLHDLAMADPLRLIRNTNFDRRAIVSWIDEAILIDLFPDHWKDFEREGINGGVDFVSLVYPPPYRQYEAESKEAMKQDREAYLHVLGRHVKLSEKSAKPDANHTSPPDDDIATIKSIARRLVNDAQLRLIWVLHNHIADETTLKVRAALRGARDDARPSSPTAATQN